MRAVDHSSLAIARARANPDNPPSLRFEEADLFDALASTATESEDVVYAHVVYMILSDPELDRLASEVARVLRPDGRHLFAVRSVRDPHFREGIVVAPDVRRYVPTDEPIQYFRKATLERFTRAGLVRVRATEDRTSHLWYVLDRRG